MSLEINVYVEEIDDSIIPKWVEELNTLGMTCEIHPEFSFHTHSGFLPFKITISNGSHEELLHETYLTGFELYVDDFELSEHIELPKKQSMLDKILKRPVEQSYFANADIDEMLKTCKKVITFNWGISDTFELRMASLGSATFAKITGGVCCYPADAIWYNNATIVEDALKEVSEYETSLKPKEFNVHTFEKWL